MTYWFDSNCYVEAHRTYFNISTSPEFWKFLHVQIDNGLIKSPLKVYQELIEYGDELSTWCKSRHKSGLNTRSSAPGVQQSYATLINHVLTRTPKYKKNVIDEFYGNADAWVIAHAMSEGGTVVTNESDKTKGGKIKIPTLCDEFEVRCIKLW